MAGETKQTKGIRPNFDGFNEDQWSAYRLATTDGNKFHLFYGGAGSGKSWLIMFIVLLRAIRARNTRHAIFRLTRNSCEQTLFNKTLYEVLDAGFADVTISPKPASMTPKRNMRTTSDAQAFSLLL